MSRSVFSNLLETQVKFVALSLFIVASSGCTGFVENHYFEVSHTGPAGQLGDKNYLRIRVEGDAYLSSARYVSGYYDERAVDLFFNELKVSSGKQTDNRPLFSDNLKSPGSDTVIKPLDPGAEHGAFVMVFSSNAKAITNAIGQFAENQVVADAITNLANQDTVRRLQDADPQPKFERDQAKAIAVELDSLIGMVPSHPPPDDPELAAKLPSKDATQRAYLRILNLIAKGLGHNVGFAKFEDAVTWFQARGGKR